MQGTQTDMEVEKCLFAAGELYLFSAHSPDCHPDSSLWGVFDCVDQGLIRLETVSYDLTFFCGYSYLPPEYRFVRNAEREEIRDFYFNQGYRTATDH